MCGLNWVFSCFWAWAHVGLRGLNWAWVIGGPFGFGVGPNWAQLARPVGPRVGYCVDVWAKLGLGFWAVYWVRIGPQLGPSQQAQLGPTLDIVWMCGLNLAWVSGGMEWASIGS